MSDILRNFDFLIIKEFVIKIKIENTDKDQLR